MKRFRQAVNEAIALCREDPQRAFEVYVAANPDKTATTQAWERQAWTKTLSALARQQEDEESVWRTYYQWLLEMGLVDEPFDVQELLE